MGGEGEYTKGYRISDCEGGIVGFDFLYPRGEGPERPRIVQVGLEDVRAADDIQITFDFERDGWSVSQASRFSWEAGEYDRIEAEGGDPEDWQEVAFIPAWGRKVLGPGDSEE